MVERRFDLTKDAVTAKTVAPNSVGSEELKDGAVTSGKIADGAVETANLADKSVTRDKLGAIRHSIVYINPPPIAPKSTVNVDKSYYGLVTSDRLLMCCMGDLEHGLVPIAAFCATEGTLTLRLTNWTDGTIDGVQRKWNLAVCKE